MYGSRLPIPAEWQTTATPPPRECCPVTQGPCWRMKTYPGMSACAKGCNRADYLNGLEYEVRE